MCDSSKPKVDLLESFVFHSMISQVPKPVGRIVLVSSLGAVFIEAIYCYFAQSITTKDFCGLHLQVPFGLINIWFGLHLQGRNAVRSLLVHCRTHAK